MLPFLITHDVNRMQKEITIDYFQWIR